MLDPAWLEQMANRRWAKVQAIIKAQQAVELILAPYPIDRDIAYNSLEQSRKVAEGELRDFQDSHKLALIIEKSEHDKVLAGMVEEVVQQNDILNNILGGK